MSEQTADFKDREYQRNIIDVCISRNSIVYLPTGAGKTYIAIQVIKHFSDSLKQTYSDGGKRSFFLVNTVALAKQQTERIKDLMPFNVAVLTGENNVDDYCADEWLDILNKHEILVMTAQCFYDAVARTFIDLKSISVIIFDECHHGRKGHVYRQIMQAMDDENVVQDIRIIGLSGMLIGNDNSTKPQTVPEELKQLESVYQSTIITVNNIHDRKNVLIYSTKAKEIYVTYEFTPIHQCLTIIRLKLSNLQEYLKPIKLNNYVTISPKTLLETVPSKIKELISLFKDFEYQTEALGCYGSYLALMSIMIQLELTKRFTDTEKFRKIVGVCITEVEFCINYLKREMGFDKKDAATVMKNSSIKVQTLLLLLKKFFEDPNREKDMQCLIFTERRSSAKILYHLIKCYGHDNPNFNMKPDFVVGRNNAMPESIETILSTSNNSLALDKFEKKETNVIVCTNVLEEGIDLQACNLVMIYDPPKTPRSYVQSRGRARDDESKYIVMLDKGGAIKFNNKFTIWQQIDFALKKELIGRTIDRSAPNLEDIKKEQAQEWEPFFTKAGACLTALNCVPILNQYAQSLPGDRFTSPSVYWQRINHDDGTFSVNLSFPTQSMINDEIIGSPRKNIKVAKQDAAFKACKMLYFNGNLTEKLTPVDSEIKIEECNPKYFDHWEKYQNENPKKTGTKNNLRLHDIKIPEAISNCGPIIGTNYLYRISIKPKFDDCNSNALKIFHKLLANENTFGILTTKRIPKLSIITLFQSYGEIECEISDLPVVTDVESEGNLRKLQKFHINIFRDILKAFQKYFVLDKSSYLIVPINEDNEIDWKLIDDFQEIQKPTLMSKTQIHNMKFNAEDYLYKVINPVYRQYTDQNYVVININEHKSPLSNFPNDTNNLTYTEYFKEKWQVDIQRNDQFLIEVKGIGKNLKLFFPGSGISGKQKKYERLTECEEYIPEICHNYKFPADFWLKATLLPAICHRMTYMLLAEELRRWLISEGIDNGYGQQIYKLDVDYGDYDQRTETLKQSEHDPPEKMDNFEDILKRFKQTEEEDSHKSKNFKTQANLAWDRSALPIDLDRNWLNVTNLDIDYYFHFIGGNKEVAETHLQMLKNQGKNGSTFNNLPSITGRIIGKDIKLLDLNNLSSCIQQKDLIKVITTAKSNDVFDMERYEALGDGFLKFIASLFLYKTHDNWHEGHLTALKGKMVSNRNLYYIGNDFGLSNILNASQFDVQTSFAPATKLPENLKQILINDKRMLTSLLDVTESLSDSEVENGLMNDENLRLFKSNALMDTDGDDQESTTTIDRSFIGFIDKKVIGDKIIADCVEALLGCTVSSVGIDATYKLCQKLKILPETQNLLSEKINPRIVHESDLTVTNKQALEKKINYKFENEIYLTQALTHASYPNNASGTYQQLEFLGDAVLDFLITSFIFENCPKMDPGKLTDLRSALVNNVTLACIIVRNDIHKHMMYENYTLSEAIKKFVIFQQSHNHEVTDQVELMNTENDTNIATSIEVPKALGDIFESIIGAVFLDTNLSLKKTWDVIYKLMQHEIHKFIYDVPIQITRRLFEFQGGIAHPQFYKTEFIENDDNVAVPLKIKMRNGDEKIFIGFGKNRKIAKEAAAKKALTELII
ncbi:endoribonuclease Dcr-2 isoform X2 [Chironomus tepperi]|uniref:endoribonuclease Dcr-2 isoform X2 n=1 Tax=Chironomus tepperi TaxID=113505 RepID=UPI00391F192B